MSYRLLAIPGAVLTAWILPGASNVSMIQPLWRSELMLLRLRRVLHYHGQQNVVRTNFTSPKKNNNPFYELRSYAIPTLFSRLAFAMAALESLTSSKMNASICSTRSLSCGSIRCERKPLISPGTCSNSRVSPSACTLSGLSKMLQKMVRLAKIG